MVKLFVSYRRADSGAITGRIYDRLQSHFGDENVVIDVDSFPLGYDFRKAIADAINDCDAVLAVIGKQWAHDGERNRLNEENDFVRIEVESALARDIPVVPILVEGATMPAAEELPQSLRGLAFRNAAEVDLGRDFHMHVDRIIRSLDRLDGDGDRAGADRTAPAAAPLDLGRGTPIQVGPAAAAATAAQVARAPEPVTTETAETAPATSLAERLERFSERHETVNFTVFALVGGFLLCMASALADVHILQSRVHGTMKEVGFLYAPNWVATYLILLPLYLMLFSILIRKRGRLLRLFAESRATVGADGAPLSEGALRAYWSKSVAKVSLILWAFVLVVVLQSTQEWVKSCLMPLLTRDTGSRVVDWSIIAATGQDSVWIWKSIFFTGFAYVYMGFALFIYLAVMLYGVAISSFVNRICETPDEIRVARMSPPLMREISEIGISIYACAFLGLCAAFVMRLQAGFVPSPYSNVLVFFFSKDLLPLLTWLNWYNPGVAADAGPIGAGINSEWTSLIVAAYALAMFSLSMFLLLRALRTAAGRDGAPQASGLALVLPRYVHLIAALILMAASIVFIGTGMLMIATLAYAGWAIMANSAAAKREPVQAAHAEA